MAEFIYDLGADPRYVLEEYIRPLENLKVIHGPQELCCADLSVTGIVVMELPPYVADELMSNHARILAWSRLSAPQTIGTETRTKEITHFEIVE